MTMKTVFSFLLGVLSAVALGAAASSVSDEDVRIAAALGIENQGEMTSPARWGAATIRVKWARDERHASQLCREAGMQTHARACAYGDSQDCKVIAVQPRSFYDVKALAIFGHEAWHCFGSTHD